MATFKSFGKPASERTPEGQYKKVLRAILEHGERDKSQQEVDTIGKIGIQMHFKLENGFPMITERNMAPKESEHMPVTVWRQAIGEIFGFVNGARTQEELEKFGCFWWKDWVTEKKCNKRGLATGDLGPGSYGSAFHDFPTAQGGTCNQFAEVIKQMRELPHLKTHLITPWIPQYTYRGEGKTQKVVVAPCHGWIHLRIINGKLTLHMFQRSGDVPVGVPSNMVQYGALTLAIAHVLGVEPYEYVHTISDAHIFVDQVPAVETMLARENKILPTMSVNTDKTDIFDFRKEDFEISDYVPHPGIKGIPVAI